MSFPSGMSFLWRSCFLAVNLFPCRTFSLVCLDPVPFFFSLRTCPLFSSLINSSFSRFCYILGHDYQPNSSISP